MAAAVFMAVACDDSMMGGIDRRTVKHDEGLAGVATSDVYSGIEFSRCLYSRYQLECFEYVVCAQKFRKSGEVFGIQPEISGHHTFDLSCVPA